jgi:hypothetical protein
MDIARGEAAERDLTRFANRRASKNGESRPGEQFANELEQSWKQGEAERRLEEERRRKVQLLFSYRRKQELHEKLADEYRARAQKLIDEDEMESA